MKRLLMISTDKNMFVDGSTVCERMKILRRDFEEINIIVFTDRLYAERSIAPNIFIYPTRSIAKWFCPIDAISIGKFICTGREITNITCQDPFFTAMAGISISKKFKIPIEIQVHTDIGSTWFTYTVGNRIRKALALTYLPKAHHIRVVSERIRSYIVGTLGIKADVIEVRPIPVDIERIQSTPVTTDLHKKYPQFDQIVLMASRLEREKDIQTAISAWSRVLSNLQNISQAPRLGLIIVGSGSQEKRLKRSAHNLDLDKSIIFESWQDNLASYYKTADLFLLTSLYEGYGMTLVEAKAAGCPIVSTDVGVAKEIGATIVGHNPEDIADGILKHLKR